MFNDTTARAIHLTFAVLIVFLAYPFSKRSPRDHVPAADWLVALAAAFCTGYIYLFHDQLSTRQGRPTTLDIAVACALGYLDLRFAGSWRADHPNLVAWLDAFEAAVPSYATTRVPA